MTFIKVSVNHAKLTMAQDFFFATHTRMLFSRHVLSAATGGQNLYKQDNPNQ